MEAWNVNFQGAIACRGRFASLRPKKIGDKHVVKYSEGPCGEKSQDSRTGDGSCQGLFLELARWGIQRNRTRAKQSLC